MLAYIVLRIGVAFSFGNVMSIACQQVPVEKTGDINSLFNMLQQYAGAVGTIILAAVVNSLELHSGSVFAETHQSSAIDYVLLIVMAAIALATVLMNQKAETLSK